MIKNYIKSCAVFGHSKIEITNNLKDILFSTFENLIKQGCEYFYFGGFGMFDDLCWQIVSELKTSFPFIKRIYCLSDERHLRPQKRPKWLKNEDYEEFIYLPLAFDYWYSRIYYRNCAIIDRSDFIIFYVKNTDNSGAYKALEYANKHKKYFINIYNQL